MLEVAAYDGIAEWYEGYVAGGLPPYAEEPVLSLLPDVAGWRVCDLACGHGQMARLLATRGAAVTGMDISGRMLDIARRHEAEQPLGVVYVRDDARTLATVADGTFDGMTCRLALMDIPDTHATFRAAARVLVPGGWFVFSVVHPCFYPPISDFATGADGTTHRRVRRYFDEIFWYSDNPDGVRGKVGAHHRTLSTYLNAARDAGLSLDRFLEPQVPHDAAMPVPGHAEIPLTLVVRCVKR